MMRWIEHGIDETLFERLSSEIELPHPLLRLLAGRGFAAADDIDGFLHPRLSRLSDPLLLPDMPAAVKRIWRAIDGGERISVYGDYDVDGLTATALMTRVLRSLGANVMPFLPEREEDGYGLQVDTVIKCIRTQECGLLVTVDCGTSSIEAVQQASALGVDVVITDHHLPGPRIAPAVANVNPQFALEEDQRCFAGVGVAFKLCHALLKAGRDSGHTAADLDLRAYMDLVALGTIADMVPLTGENRILARHGLHVMRQSSFPGINALIKVAGIGQTLNSYDVGFRLGPRLNAAGRMGQAQRALELLLTDDPARALDLAKELDAENRERQKVEKDILRKAEAALAPVYNEESDFAVVAAGRGWHAGVIGIVASRLVRKMNRPVVVIAIDESGCGRGSCRSIKGFNIVEALADCSVALLRYGGHHMAAGLEVEEERLPDFIRSFHNAARSRLTAEDLIPTIGIDSWIALEDVDAPLYEAQEQLNPTGQGNPAPVWAVRGVRMQNCRQVGDGHLKCDVVLGNTCRNAIGFNMWTEQDYAVPVDIAFRLQKNEFRGRTSYELNMIDFRASE